MAVTFSLDPYATQSKTDFIAYQFTLPERTNLRRVRPILSRILNLPLERICVEVRDADEFGCFSRFRLKLHDPRCYAEVEHIAAAISDELGAIHVAPHMIELAMDVGKGGSKTELASICAHLFLMADQHVSSNIRMVGPSRKAHSLPSTQATLVKRFEAGWQLYIGNQKPHFSRGSKRLPDVISFHIYLKTHDQGKVLNAADWVARMEVRVQGENLPYRDLEQVIDRIGFGRLTDLFSFRCLKPEHQIAPNDLRRYRMAAAPLFDQRPVAALIQKRGHHPDTVANVRFNKRIADSFRRLSTRWQEKPSVGKSRSISRGVGARRESPAPAVPSARAAIGICTNARDAINCSMSSLHNPHPTVPIENSELDLAWIEAKMYIDD